MFNDTFFDMPEYEQPVEDTKCPEGQVWDDTLKKCVPALNLNQVNANINYSNPNPGANKETADKGGKLSEINNNWLAGLQKKVDDTELEYATTLFTSLDKAPLYNNKPIALSELSAAFADPKKRKAIMDQAYALDDNPELDAETKWGLIENHLKSINLSAVILEGNKRMTEDLYRAAELKSIKDQQNGGVKSIPYTTLFSNGKILSEDEWTLKVIKDRVNDYNDHLMSERLRYRNAHPEEFRNDKSIYNLVMNGKSNAFPSNTQSTSANKPVVMINTPGVNFNKLKDQQIQQNMNDFASGKYAWDTEFETEPNAKNYKNHRFYKFYDLDGKYQQYLDEVYKQYNASYDPANMGPKSARKLSADIQDMIPGNKGGMVHGTSMTIPFDFKKPIKMVDEFSEDPATRRPVLNRNVQKMDEGVNELIQLLSYSMGNKDNVIIGLGGIKDKVPSESWSRGLEAMQLIAQHADAGHKTGGLIPKGSIEFQGVVGGDTKYHAYHVKMDPAFFGHRQFAGEGKIGKMDDDPKVDNKELINNGFTIYVPAEESSSKLPFGQYHKRSSVITPAEALVNTAGLDVNIPGAGGFKFIKTGANSDSLIMNSYQVRLNETGRMDTLRPKADTIPLGRNIDIQGVYRDNIEYLKSIWFKNQKIKELIGTPGQIVNQ